MSHWWEGYPWRMVQTNLREIDMADIDAGRYAQSLADFGATVVTLNAAGIIAGYDTKLDFQTKSGYLTGATLREVIDACHARGIRVIARTDFSKIRYPVYERHPDWAYRDADGKIVNYNGDVQTCPNGEYQQEKMFEILREVLTTHPFDGVFCNMSGFLVVDYSGVYHGPCHCENCVRKFREKYGLDIPAKDDPKNPDYRRYAAFKNECIREHRERLAAVVKGIDSELAVNGVDYIRTESNTEIGRAQWQYSASSNARKTAGPLRNRPADNASVDFLGFRYRDTSVSPALMALRQWQNLANAGSVSLYIMGRFDNHRDRSGFEASRRAFAFHRAHEELFSRLTSAARVGLVHRGIMALNDPEAYGWIRALTESHIPFDERKLAELTEEELGRWDVVILGDIGNLSPDQARLLDAFAGRGGTVLATGGTGFAAEKQLLKCLGIKKLIEHKKGLMSSVFEITETDALVFPRSTKNHYIAPGGSYMQAEYEAGTDKWLRMIPEHPFGPPERCYYTEVTDFPGITVHPYGAGKGIFIPWLTGSFYFNEGYQNSLDVMQDVLFELCGLPELAPGLSPMVEMTVCRKEEKTVIQLVNGSGVFGNSYFEPLPVRDIALRLPGMEEKQGTALAGGRVTCRSADGSLIVCLDVLNEYEAIVLE